MRKRRWRGWEGDVEIRILCFALAASIASTVPAVTGPAKAGHYRNEARPSTGPAQAGHYRNEARPSTGPAQAGHYRDEAKPRTDPAEAGHYRDETQTQITDARDAGLGSAQTIVEIDTGKLKGDPGMLAWAPDGKALYLQMIERDRKGAVTSTKHYVIAVAEKTITSAESQPAWVGAYWAWKAAPSSPAASTFKIVPSERDEVKHAVAPVGDLAKGGAGGDGRNMGTSAAEAVAAQATAQKVHIWALKVDGETIGEWVNEAVTPGSNFSWAPAPAHLLAYTRRDGGPLLLLDDQGRRTTLAGAKNASFPAWSDEGTRIAWLEKKDRRKYDLMIAGIAAK
jgi:hypothetical protein